MKAMNKLLPLILILFVAPCFADEEILIDTDEKAKAVLLGHDWECKWKYDVDSGTSKRVYEEASLKKVTAKVKDSFCPTGWQTLEGKIKEGRISGYINAPAPCFSKTFSGKIYKSADGSYYTKDSFTIDGYPGQFNCVAVAK